MVLGLNIAIYNFGHGCTEGPRGSTLNIGDSGKFLFQTGGIVEYLDGADTFRQRVFFSALLFRNDYLPPIESGFG